MPCWGAIEAGGTKLICAVGTGPEDLHAQIQIPTTTPAETLPPVIEFFQQQSQESGPLQSIGIGSFGPVDPNPNSPTWGYLLDTPKPGWTQIDLVGQLRQHFQIPIAFDTDVNAAALGEYHWGAAQGLESFIYLTVGTGIGGGGVINGKLMHGLLHPEMGHIRIPHNFQQDPFPGVCPFHGDCLEGLASGVAMEQRWKQKSSLLAPDHPAWELEAQYLALGLVNFIFMISPQRIILGGGVMQQSHLFPLIHTQVKQLLGNYLNLPILGDRLHEYIVPPMLGNQAGILGSIALAQQAG